jgi:hypothetical protein
MAKSVILRINEDETAFFEGAIMRDASLPFQPPFQPWVYRCGEVRE